MVYGVVRATGGGEASRRSALGVPTRWTVWPTPILLLALTLMLPGPVAGQEVAARLSGRVVDASGSGIADALVAVEGPAVLGVRSGVTGPEGWFELGDLPVAQVLVRVTRIGYRTTVLTHVPLGLGRTTALGEVTLPVAAVELEPLLVRADPSLIDPTSTSLGGYIPQELFEAIPLGRDYRSMVHVLPHAEESHLGDPVNIAGSTGLENGYYIDGVNVTDVYRGRTGTDLPYNFVKAIEVKQGGYEAEHGSALGGVMNVVTRSGADDFRWEVFAFRTASELAAEARPIPETLAQESFSDLDVGVSASGPIVGEELTFFTAYNPRFERADVALPGLGLEQATWTRHAFAGKLDWRPSERVDASLSLFGDPTSERRVNPAPGITLANADPILSSNDEGGVNVALRSRGDVSSDLRVEFMLSRHGRSEHARGATERGRSEPSFIDRTDLPTILLSGGNGTDQEISSSRTSARLVAALRRPEHLVKWGFEVQVNRLDVSNRENPGQIALLPGPTYRSSFFLQDFTVESRVLTAFLQDRWSPSRHFNLNAGLRWDAQFLLDQDGEVRQTIADQIQPRLGFTLLPGRDGRTKLFGHAGRFYQQLALFWSTIGLAGFDQRQVFSGVDPRAEPDRVDSVLVISDPGDIRGGTEGMKGEHHDELVLGVERQLGNRLVLGVRGIHRRLRASVTAAFRPDGTFAGGNPGSGPLEHLPASVRRYWGLDLTARVESEHLRLLAAYVLSETSGNHPGLFVAESGGLRGGSSGPNNSQSTYFPAQAINAEGPLPNDRPHVFKVTSAVELTPRIEVGTFFSVRSGTPLSELGRVTSGFNAPLFLEPRGSAGRTPTNWDLSLRLAMQPTPDARILLDFLHIGNPQEVVNVDQRRFNGARGSPFASFETLVGNQRGERPGFGGPVGFQPPFQVRLGLEVRH